MRAAAILGLGCSPKDLRLFQTDQSVEWRMGVPSAEDAVDAIVLLGGDGTVHRHLSQLVKLGLPVLVVPAGSGNDFARALGFKRMRDSLAAWKSFCLSTSNAHKIDLGTVSPREAAGLFAHDSGLEAEDSQLTTRHSEPGTRYFCCVAGIGLDAEVARRANGLPRWLRGNGGYVLSLLPTIFRFAPFRLQVHTKEAEAADWTLRSDQPTLLAAFANTPLYGGGMKIAPQAKMDDGLLDVCIVGGVGAFKLFCMFPTVYSGRHLKIREVEYFHARRIRVQTEHPLDVYADGE